MYPSGIMLSGHWLGNSHRSTFSRTHVGSIFERYAGSEEIQHNIFKNGTVLNHLLVAESSLYDLLSCVARRLLCLVMCDLV